MAGGVNLDGLGALLAACKEEVGEGSAFFGAERYAP